MPGRKCAPKISWAISVGSSTWLFGAAPRKSFLIHSSVGRTEGQLVLGTAPFVGFSNLFFGVMFPLKHHLGANFEGATFDVPRWLDCPHRILGAEAATE